MRNKVFLVIGLLVGATQLAVASPTLKRCWCEYKGGGGGEVPSPFSNTNQVVELADGETYTLIGRIVFKADIAYLEVNLDVHAWLANARRKADPYYRLIGTAAQFKAFEQKEVKMLVHAHAELIPVKPSLSLHSYSAGDFNYAITLTPSPTVPITVLDDDQDSEWNR